MTRQHPIQHWRLLRLLAGGALVATLLGGSAVAQAASPGNAHLDHVFVIMLENHSAANVIDNKDANGVLTAPYITSLAHRYGTATQYFGVTHPSLPNYVAAISGSNWFVNNDNPANRFDHLNLVDQLESKHISWGAYMESMPANNPLADFWPDEANPLYVSKHNPFVLFEDIRSNPARLANIKPYTSLAKDLNSKHAPAFVWISPNQCHDLHGGLNNAVDPSGADGTPCPFGTTSPTQDAKDLALIKSADRWVAGCRPHDHHVQGVDRQQRHLPADRRERLRVRQQEHRLVGDRPTAAATRRCSRTATRSSARTGRPTATSSTARTRPRRAPTAAAWSRRSSSPGMASGATPAPSRTTTIRSFARSRRTGGSAISAMRPTASR